MMISKADHGKSMNWVTIMYSQLVKELIRWGKCYKNVIEGITKRAQKGCIPFCHCFRSYILEMVFSQRSRTTREQEAK
jgi:hypothetical protein